MTGADPGAGRASDRRADLASDPRADRRSGPASGAFPRGFFDRQDPTPDTGFYDSPRFVTHIDDGAITAVGQLYADLGIDGSTPGRRVLDLMSSWVSHLRVPPDELVVLGLNGDELAANPAATGRVVQDLNADPRLPFPDASFDAVLCCVSIDYLVRPVEVIAEAARVLVPGGVLAITFSNRCFPTKAVRGWLATDDAGRCAIVAEYVRAAGGFAEPEVSLRTSPRSWGDPLYAVLSRRLGGSGLPGTSGTDDGSIARERQPNPGGTDQPTIPTSPAAAARDPKPLSTQPSPSE